MAALLVADHREMAAMAIAAARPLSPASMVPCALRMLSGWSLIGTQAWRLRQHGDPAGLMAPKRGKCAAERP